MANDAKPGPGQSGWIDLTVPDAEAVRDFYREETGWTPSPVARGGQSAAGRFESQSGRA